MMMMVPLLDSPGEAPIVTLVCVDFSVEDRHGTAVFFGRGVP